MAKKTKKNNFEAVGTTVQKPWGYYTILHNNIYEYEADPEYNSLTCVVKLLVIKEGHRLSLQSHNNKDETWFVIRSNKYSIQIGDKIYSSISNREPLTINRYTLHRAEAFQGDLHIIEVTTGYNIKEEDITRIHDDYNRK